MVRGRILGRIRAWFAEQGFIEVDCGALQVSPGNEAHLHAFTASLINPDGSSEVRYLHTSPEFACKKLLAAGEKRIFSMVHCFRNRERTPLHAPEFTMLEWYRAGEPYERIIADTVEMLRLAALETGNQLTWRGKAADALQEAEYLSVADAFARYAGIDLLATLSAGGADAAALGAQARSQGVSFAAADSWSDIFSRILVERVEPHLGQGRPTVLFEYPAVEAALARVSPRDPRIAERFELYAAGVELANGFGELTDPVEQRRRFEADMALKQKLYGERYPIDESFLEALRHMPEASGVALGLDRLVLLATGATRIDQVIWTPFS
ncbi:EF-P lysine aminoacylase GenX [Nordella sp. HKS 07]|uniref:EF-P lysine aminoacylase EpmA n=1 Tax=Nordella sp. HKS 07 TaxID=2712222 RepID=UPI0013E1F89D|nr:EF-P lysine aminoacylase EpmA [Nordella sp. HKS 07]QIG50344.1 EF-P lysine aminoacylase GenX [Nordella sp. HKS 07]